MVRARRRVAACRRVRILNPPQHRENRSFPRWLSRRRTPHRGSTDEGFAIRFTIISGALALAGCLVASSAHPAETCIASVFDEGSRLADGSRWSRELSRAEPLAAHRHLPLGSRIRVTRLDTGAMLDVAVRDRGPFVRGRCVDLSVAAAARLGFSGLARVRVEPIP